MLFAHFCVYSSHSALVILSLALLSISSGVSFNTFIAQSAFLAMLYAPLASASQGKAAFVPL